MGEVEIFGWLGLKFGETTLATKKIWLSVMCTGVCGAGRVHLHAADEILHEAILCAEALRVRRSCMLMLVFSAVGHWHSLLGKNII
jgi:hypothetical protein